VEDANAYFQAFLPAGSARIARNLQHTSFVCKQELLYKEMQFINLDLFILCYKKNHNKIMGPFSYDL